MSKSYKVNEIFYSLQGEGRWAGSPAIFIRFSGCNLKCPFCDTDFSGNALMSASEIVDTISQWKPCHFVVLTGGEPTLQVDRELLDALHKERFYVAMETNGTRNVPEEVDWVTVSPKKAYVPNGNVILKGAHEIKVVYDGNHIPVTYGMSALFYYVQPCDTGDPVRNKEIIEKCVEFVKANPMWKLSLQQQKIINVR